MRRRGSTSSHWWRSGARSVACRWLVLGVCRREVAERFNFARLRQRIGHRGGSILRRGMNMQGVARSAPIDGCYRQVTTDAGNSVLLRPPTVLKAHSTLSLRTREIVAAMANPSAGTKKIET